jgi:hypothetical protein
MKLRIGYVNVRGLSRASWEACHQLLDTRFDYLFIAETWFVNHKIYVRDRRFIATTIPAAKNLHGRQRGGIYLLGSYQARSKVQKLKVTEHSITFAYGKHSFTGVYFPPTTLDVTTLTSLLQTLQSSTVILGDINTRFRDPLYQSGEPGPPERLQVFLDFLTTTGHQHLKPGRGTEKLTTDHCFAQPGQEWTLELLSNQSRKIPTDHQYTLCLTRGARDQSETPIPDLTRFRVSQLTNPRMNHALLDLISQSSRPFSPGDDVNQMNTRLVRFCQEIQEKTVGRAVPSQNRARQAQRPQVRDQTLRASIQLYKQASQSSQENDVIFPTPDAHQHGMDALMENLTILKERWAGQPFQAPQIQASVEDVTFWTRAQVVNEIQQQEAEKSCGADGIHIRFLKAVHETRIITWLQELYNQCLREGRTPQAWNQSEVYLLTKDRNQERNAKNLRPISIICLFRKVFERLLLLQVQDQQWAQLHLAQAGFRRSYSTYSNAAVVHTLLASTARSTAVFLDFKSAFDVVDHQRLDAKLAARKCPGIIRHLIQNLMFLNLRSRILINGQVTDWFARSRGVFQGSPLSPWLFNLFVDDLLCQVNAQAPGIPQCLFYADDGVLITHSRTDVAQLLQIVEEWTVTNAIFLNPAKCAVVTSRSDLPSLRVYGQEIPRAERYTYLGFPLTAHGIDFPRHLEQRIQAAIGRARWLGVQSNSWGPAHRLRIYKQFLAPMFEYGAPLVWAWAQENTKHQQAFDLACSGFKDLMAWISNTSDSRYLVTANLCGLSTPGQRFQHLGTAYQLILEQMDPETPLKQLVTNSNLSSSLQSFAHHLGTDPGYLSFKETSSLEPTVRAALSRFLRTRQFNTIRTESLQSHLTRLIPMSSRTTPGLLLADISLAAPISVQNLLLQYRRGVFMYNCICACDPQARFSRGHEECKALNHLVQLSRPEQGKKQEMKSKLSLCGTKFTNIDFLLNSKQLRRVAFILLGIRAQLREVYKESQVRDVIILTG